MPQLGPSRSEWGACKVSRSRVSNGSFSEAFNCILRLQGRKVDPFAQWFAMCNAVGFKHSGQVPVVLGSLAEVEVGAAVVRPLASGNGAVG